MAFLSKEMLSKATKNTMVKDHPLMKANVSLNVRQSYLQGCVLAVLMENDSISGKARETLDALGKSLHLEVESVQDAISLVTNLADAEKESFVSEMLQAVKAKPVGAWFLFDFERLMGVDKPISADSYNWLNHFGDVLCSGHGWRGDVLDSMKDAEHGDEWFRMAKNAADSGDDEGKSWVGWAYACGKHVEQDEKRGLQYLNEGADHNFDIATFFLGCIHERNSRFKEAFSCYSTAAKQGCGIAMVKLGDSYLNGLGVAENQKMGTQWYRRAIDVQGSDAGLAYGKLAACYMLGWGVAIDYQEAFSLANKGAALNDGDSQSIVARCYEEGLGTEPNSEMGRQSRLKAADAGNDVSQIIVGHMYLSGNGVEENRAKAFSYFMKAAEQGNAEAQNMVAMCYSRGDGVAQNNDEHFKWVLRAAENGDLTAMNNLAIAYSEGIGCSRNEHEALEWQIKSAESGNGDAQSALGMRYINGDGVEEDINLAFEWCNKAADQGVADAQYFMGLFYENGRGCDADMNEALRWYRLAADQDEPNALTRLGCYAIDEEGDLRKAKNLLRRAANLGDEAAQEKLNEIL